jgi:galactokinase
MEQDPPLSIQNWTPPFVPPLLRALERLNERDAITPAGLTARANDNLIGQLGVSSEVVERTFSHGTLGIAVDHTVLFDGFALLIPVRDGIAVAIRDSADRVSRLVFEGEEYCWSFDAGSIDSLKPETPWWAQIVMRVLHALDGITSQVDISVVSTIVPSCEESYGAALAVSCLRTLQSVFALALEDEEVFSIATHAIVESTGRPCSIAYAIASDAAIADSFMAIDVKTGRHTDFPVALHDEIAFGLIETGKQKESVAALLERRQQEADGIAERLRKKQFPELDSIRDLQHKDLELAEKALSRGSRPLLRHLVRENQRVHRLMVAARKGDWQLFGALMLMSHASLDRDFGYTVDETDMVVQLAEERSADGIHGARALGSAGAVLVLGRPFVVPAFLDEAKVALQEQFGIAANTVLL